MKRLAFIAATLFAGTAHADFVMDKTALELRKAIKKPAIADLAIGETGIKNQPWFCVKDGRLYLFSGMALDETPSTYGLAARIKRLPDGAVSVQIPSAPKGDTVEGAIASALNDAYVGTCEAKAMLGGELLEVSDINGKSKASDFLNK
ncbi:hypothetical protein FG152_13570 [Ochrobactrum sp. XJ1]|nr:hypothetical protein [Ochrobactrum sp. XJ1]